MFSLGGQVDEDHVKHAPCTWDLWVGKEGSKDWLSVLKMPLELQAWKPNWAKKEDGFANDQRLMAYHWAFHLKGVEC
jgi:hypothetical protein